MGTSDGGFDHTNDVYVDFKLLEHNFSGLCVPNHNIVACIGGCLDQQSSSWPSRVKVCGPYIVTFMNRAPKFE